MTCAASDDHYGFVDDLMTRADEPHALSASDSRGTASERKNVSGELIDLRQQCLIKAEKMTPVLERKQAREWYDIFRRRL